MPSLNFDLDYFDHPKTKRLVRILGRGSDSFPMRLWVFAGKYFKDEGRLIGVQVDEIETEIGWWGESGKAVDALIECRWLEKDGDTFVIHGWVERNGHLSAYENRAKVAAKARWDKARGIALSIKNSEKQPDTSNAPSIATGNALTVRYGTELNGTVRSVAAGATADAGIHKKSGMNGNSRAEECAALAAEKRRKRDESLRSK